MGIFTRSNPIARRIESVKQLNAPLSLPPRPVESAGKLTIDDFSRGSATQPPEDISSKRVYPPVTGEWTTYYGKITPEQMISLRLSAQMGNWWASYQLTSFLERDWPVLRDCLHEIREAASRAKYRVNPFAVQGQEPTESAKKKAEEFSIALSKFNPQPGTDEVGLEGMIYNFTNAIVSGVSVDNILWEQDADNSWYPRAAIWIFQPQIGFTENGSIGINSGFSSLTYGSQLQATELDPNKFIISKFQTRSGPMTTYGLLWPLMWWGMAAAYGRDWLFKTAQIFAAPIRWATYPQSTADAVIDKVETLVKNMGSTAYACFPEGVKLELIKVAQAMADNPQMHIQTLADKYATLTVTRSTLTSDVADSGSRALGDVHADTKLEGQIGLARWVVNNPFKQLAMAWCRLNYGDTDECPVLDVDSTKPESLVEKTTRLTLAAKLVSLPKSWTHKELQIPIAEDGEETIGGAPEPVDPNAEQPAPGEEKEEEKTEASEMLHAALGNGDKHNRVYEFTDGTRKFRSLPAAALIHASDPASGSSAQKAKQAAQLSSKVAADLSAANAPLQARLKQLQNTPDEEFVVALEKLLSDYPALSKTTLQRAKLSAVPKSLTKELGIAMLEGMTEQ